MINDSQKDRLQIILNDEVLLDAIRAVFDQAIEKAKPEVNENDDNNVLGEKYRAYELAKSILEEGFIGLYSHQIKKKGDKSFNRGR